MSCGRSHAMHALSRQYRFSRSRWPFASFMHDVLTACPFGSESMTAVTRLWHGVITICSVMLWLPKAQRDLVLGGRHVG